MTYRTATELDYYEPLEESSAFELQGEDAPGWISQPDRFAYAPELLEDEPDYQIIGIDDRKLIRNTRVQPFRFICKLEMIFEHSGTKRRRHGGCTGTLIASNKVLTAAHCLYKPGYGYAKKVRVIPGKNGRIEPFGHAFATRLNVPTGYRTARNNSARRPFDYGVVTLSRPLGKRTGWWRLIKPMSKAFLLKHRVNTAGYPGDKGGKHQYWAYDRIVRVHKRNIEYLHDTFGGQSGSPVWVRWKKWRIIIGIHNTRDIGGPPVANTGMRITPAILAEIRNWVRR